MNKRIRKKIAKRAAEHAEPLTPTAALQHAVEELKDSALGLLEAALHELQLWTSSVVAELRSRAVSTFSAATHRN